jgi:hypothetical protein
MRPHPVTLRRDVAAGRRCSATGSEPAARRRHPIGDRLAQDRARGQVVREALKRNTAQRRSAIAPARLIERAEASGYSSARGVNPIERAALVNRLRKPGMRPRYVGKARRSSTSAIG